MSKQIKSAAKYLFYSVGVLSGSIVLCVALSLLAGVIPNDSIADNQKESLEYIEQKGLYPSVFHNINRTDTTNMIGGFNSTTIDNYTNNLMIQEANNSKSLITNEQIMGQRKNTPYQNVVQNTFFSSGYDRYWHGYLVWLKPLLTIFSYKSIIIILAISFLALLIAAAYAIKKTISLPVSLLFLLSMLFITPEVIAVSPQQYSTFGLMLIAIIVMLTLLQNKKLSIRNTPLFFIAIGAFTSFFDLLTTPLVTLGIPLLLYIAWQMSNNNTPSKPKWLNTLLASAMWGVGYLVTWFSKWLITSIILGENRIGGAITQILYRSDGCNGSICYGKVSTILNNLQMAPTALWLGIIATVMIVWIIVLMQQKHRWNKSLIQQIILICLIGILPILWFVIVKQHSAIHYWFTFRILVVSIFASLLLIYYSAIYISHTRSTTSKNQNCSFGSNNDKSMLDKSVSK
jgi:hypothetical protein